MAVTSSTLMRWRTKKVEIVGEIPDYALLFYHNVSKWEDDNQTTHGDTPTPDSKNEIFYVYPLSLLAKPDVICTQEPDTTPTYPSMYYIVRCVDSATNWPEKCDIRYSANTTLTDKHSSLFTSGGRHAITTLLGRPKPSNPVSNGIPKLRSEAPQNATTGQLSDRVVKYNIEHTGHVHRSENLRSTILSSKPAYEANPSADVDFMSNLSLCAIFKNPKKSTAPITTFPKNTLIFYYGVDTLEAQYFEPNYSHPKTPKNVGNLYLPISFMPGENSACVHTGIQNYDPAIGTDRMVINVSSNTAGYHDHINIQSYSPAKFASVTRGKADVIVNIGDTRNPVGHTHKIKYNLSVSLKSKILKTYLTKSNLAPIVDGIIIGYTLGKFSGYSGSTTDGVNVLPPNWYFCDGTNGTPDLRGYYPFTNFENEPSGQIVNENNKIAVNSIEVETVPWVHNHIGFSTDNTTGNPGYLDVGSHTTTYDASATTHNHGIEDKADHFDPTLGTPGAIRRTNVRDGDQFPYTPPTVDIAFIMFKGGAVDVADPPAPPPTPPAPSTSECALFTLTTSPDKTPFNTIDIGIESRVITVTGRLTGGPVYGGYAYTSDSDMNVAAVHAGLVAVGETRQIRQWYPQDWSNIPISDNWTGTTIMYTGYYVSTKNGVTTLAYPNPICGVLLRPA
jgi:hypothetical protein